VASYTFTIEDAPRGEDVQVLSQGLTAHSLAYTQVPGFKPIGVFMRDEHGALVGGVWGYVNWNWLFVGLVWVSDLDTFSFQARPFYEGLGYEVFCTLDNYPPGHQRFFMKKALK